jgi:hypothetical protein
MAHHRPIRHGWHALGFRRLEPAIWNAMCKYFSRAKLMDSIRCSPGGLHHGARTGGDRRADRTPGRRIPPQVGSNHCSVYLVKGRWWRTVGCAIKDWGKRIVIGRGSEIQRLERFNAGERFWTVDLGSYGAYRVLLHDLFWAFGSGSDGWRSKIPLRRGLIAKEPSGFWKTNPPSTVG